MLSKEEQPENARTNACYAVGDFYTRQAMAILKRPITNARYAVGNCDTRQFAAAVERRTTNARYTVGDFYTRQTTAIIEGAVKKIATRYRYRF